MVERFTALVVTVAVGAVLAGCGLGAGDAPSSSPELRVTRDFGAVSMYDEDTPKVGGADTVMRLLDRNTEHVEKRFGGGFVQAIDGIGADQGSGQTDWFFYVNGLLSRKGAADVKLHGGDRVWWDRHEWSAADRIPAVVGSFPEPFAHGVDGRRHPLRLECVVSKELCDTAQQQLQDAGVIAFKGQLGSSFAPETLRVLVGPWKELASDTDGDLIGRGPGASGVFAKPSRDGRTITTLDSRGRPVRTLGPGTGLVAATERKGKAEEQDPVWFVTGTDTAGVEAAVAALDEGALAGHFAIVVVDGKPVALPERAK